MKLAPTFTVLIPARQRVPASLRIVYHHHIYIYIYIKITCAGNRTCTHSLPAHSTPIALSIRPQGQLCKLFKDSPYFLAENALLCATWDIAVSKSVTVEL